MGHYINDEMFFSDYPIYQPDNDLSGKQNNDSTICSLEFSVKQPGINPGEKHCIENIEELSAQSCLKEAAKEVKNFYTFRESHQKEENTGIKADSDRQNIEQQLNPLNGNCK